MEASQSSTQQDVDQITAGLEAVVGNVEQLQTNLADSQTKLQGVIDQLASAGGTPPPSLDALRAVAAELGQHVSTAEQAAADLGSLQPTPATPAAPPPPEG